MVQIMISPIVANIMAKTSACSGLTPKLGVVILGSVIATGLIPYREAIAQHSTFHGVRVSPQLQLNSDLAEEWIRKGATPYQVRNDALQYDRLAQWLPIPGSEDNYTTYDRMTFSGSGDDFRTITLLTGTTSDNPRKFDFLVDCTANTMSLHSFYSFSANGETIGRKSEIGGTPASPESQFQQSLVDGVCGLGS
ncbi:hypothetical protein IQ273_14040 [Nodosilinea sp. LEGE 07298]|uniref:hypothetical protein n=1 Tax=Nodosilinea sp. LEGE 07298 TaxID=2777970 RepID=UPI0018825315|nr:hypothetical protein [Nodosilinea sp. LEGE 07298]MBE9110537.1 hypothetical protein [Nodosilinea sp. LEGE 07298]